MMNFNALAFLLFAHWVGDYPLQTGQMAQQKHKSLKWLTIHVGVYGITLLVFSLFLFDLRIAALFAGINAVLHWVTDFFTSKVSAKFVERPRIFYPILGLDQLIHTIALMYTLRLYQGELN